MKEGQTKSKIKKEKYKKEARNKLRSIKKLTALRMK